MPDTAPDHFDAPIGEAVASDRPTAPGVGGIRGIRAEEIAAAFGRRPAPAVDPRRTAAAQRLHTITTPRLIRLRGSAIATTGTPTVIYLDGPAAGWLWHIRRINVGPLDYSAGSFPTGIYVVSTIAGADEPGLPPDSAGQVISSTAAYPAEGTWGMGEATLGAGDHLRVIVTGLTTGTTVTAGGQAWAIGADIAHVDVSPVF